MYIKSLDLVDCYELLLLFVTSIKEKICILNIGDYVPWGHSPMMFNVYDSYDVAAAMSTVA